LKKRFTEQQIVSILREIDAGATAIEVGRPDIGGWRKPGSGIHG